MPIETISGWMYGPARTLIRPPISSGDCPMYPTFDALVEQEQQVGRGCSVRFGMGFARRTKAQIMASCALPVPNVASAYPSPIRRHLPCYVLGTGFGPGPGVLTFANASTWAAVTMWWDQVPSGWTPTRVDVASAEYPGVGITTMWIYVLNMYGQRNANGKQWTVL